MRFKLDENFGTRTQQIFRAAGHDVETVRDEGLQGCPDERLYEVVCGEQRCLITLDLDFSNVVRFPPFKSKGIVVIRVPQNPTLPLLEQLVRQFLTVLAKTPVEKRLWIVEVGRIRMHDIDEEISV